MNSDKSTREELEEDIILAYQSIRFSRDNWDWLESDEVKQFFRGKKIRRQQQKIALPKNEALKIP